MTVPPSLLTASALPATEPRTVTPGRIAFEASPSPLALEARNRLTARYGDCPFAQAEIVVALGGDGFMLETIHRVLERNVPVYGMNRGSVGFLMNVFSEEDLPGRLSRAQAAELFPLRMHAVTETGSVEEAMPSTRSACCGNCARPRKSASPSMAACASPNYHATAC